MQLRFRMKKTLLSVLAIVAIVLLVAPNFVGGGIHSAATDTLLTLVPEDARKMLEVRQNEIQRGWFSSHARVQLGVDGLDQLIGRPVLLNLDMTIHHGPLLFTPRGVKLGTAFARISPSVSGLRPQDFDSTIDMETGDSLLFLVAGFDSRMELGFEVDRLVAGARGGTLAVDGLQGRSSVSPDLSNQADVTLEKTTLYASNSQFDLSIYNLAASGWNANLQQPFAETETRLDIARMESNAPLPVSAESLHLEYRLVASQTLPETMSLTQQLDIGSIDWEFPVTALDWSFQLSQVSRSLLDSYSRFIARPGQSVPLSQTQAGDAIADLGRELLLRLAREDFQIDTSLQLAAYDSDHSLHLDINWPGLPDLPDVDAFDPGLALNEVEFFLTVDADQAALMNSPLAQTVTDYQALLVVEGGRVQASVSLTNGEVTLNDEIFPLRQFVNF